MIFNTYVWNWHLFNGFIFLNWSWTFHIGWERYRIEKLHHSEAYGFTKLHFTHEYANVIHEWNVSLEFLHLHSYVGSGLRNFILPTRVDASLGSLIWAWGCVYPQVYIRGRNPIDFRVQLHVKFFGKWMIDECVS